MPIEVVDVEVEQLRARYVAACHAVQTGVRMLIEIGDSLATPKHLRVGVDSALASDGALVRLLIRKGIITEREHLEALVEAMEAERSGYEHRLTERLGKQITLL